MNLVADPLMAVTDIAVWCGLDIGEVGKEEHRACAIDQTGKLPSTPAGSRPSRLDNSHRDPQDQRR